MKAILQFAPPVLCSVLLYQFYSLVDTLIVGRCLGNLALAGVGSTGSMNFLVMGFVMGLCNGFMIPLAQHCGAKNPEGMRKVIAYTKALCIVFAAVISVLSCLLAGPGLRWMNTPDTILAYAQGYILVIFAGIPVSIFSNVTSGIIRTLGDSRFPFLVSVFSTALNVILDLLLILVIPMSVTGAALATVLSQLFTGVVCTAYLKKHFPELLDGRIPRHPEYAYVRVLLLSGVPMGLQFTITAVGSVILQTAVNGLGDAAVTAQTAAGRVGGLMACPFDALATTMTVYAGQNTGAGKYSRLTPGLRACFFIGMIYTAAANLFVTFFAPGLAALFLDDPNPTVITWAAMAIRWSCAFYPFLLLVNSVRYVIQGMGYASLAMIAGACELVARAFAALLLVPRIGYTGVCLASPIAWLLADIFLISCYLHLIHKLMPKAPLDAQAGIPVRTGHSLLPRRQHT